MRLSSPNIPPTSTMSISPHILIVDDDADVRQLVTDYLGDFDLRVTGASDGAAMRSTLAHNVVDLILLDIKLPSEDGMTIARELRVKSSIPIIMLTSRKDDVDRIMGLEVGADDYLTKPFNPRELVARIRTVLRRTQSQPAQASPGSVRAYRFADWELNLRTRRLTSQTGEPVELTHTEFALLVAFLNAPQRILSREQLLELIRGDDGEVFDRSIDVQILRLRRKVESNSSRPELIKTERGLGYLFNAKVDPVA
ncbi:MAG: response regulator [Betaproteobacteria bacterium]